jgi:hypothetical protein
MKRIVTLTLMLAALLAGSPAFAQSDLSVRLRGAIDAVTAQSVTVTTLTGQTLTIAVPAKAPVMDASKARLRSIKPGRKAMIAATKAPDGTMTAQFITVGKPGVTPPM